MEHVCCLLHPGELALEEAVAGGDHLGLDKPPGGDSLGRHVLPEDGSLGRHKLPGDDSLGRHIPAAPLHLLTVQKLNSSLGLIALGRLEDVLGHISEETTIFGT